MRKPVAVTMLILVVLLFTLPPFCLPCLPLPSSMAAGTTHIPGGCHGRGGPMPTRVRSCCYATNQALATVPIRPAPVLLNVVLGCVGKLNHSRCQQQLLGTVRMSDISPPLRTILRI